MSEISFTPGPWKTIKPGHGHETEYLSVQIGKDETYTTLEMLPADARLVSAAPDLLAACEECLRTVDECYKKTGHFKVAHTSMQRMVIEEAINKAKGITSSL